MSTNGCGLREVISCQDLIILYKFQTIDVSNDVTYTQICRTQADTNCFSIFASLDTGYGFPSFTKPVKRQRPSPDQEQHKFCNAPFASWLHFEQSCRWRRRRISNRKHPFRVATFLILWHPASCADKVI